MAVVRSIDELSVGARLGPYVLDEELGRGATATVFRSSRSDGLQVALKVLAADVDPVLARRFERESEVASRLDHPYLVPVLDHGVVDGRRFLATRLADRGSLADRLAEGPLPLVEVIQIVRQIGAGLDVLHRARLIHRDVKPANVLVTSDGVALTDFGVVRGEEQSVLTQVGTVVGTADYLAPEAIRGEEVGPAADLYGLGCLAYACAAGAPPFAGKRSIIAVCRAHLSEPPPDPRVERPSIPPPLATAILTALAKDPADRPGTGTAYALLLRAAARGAQLLD
jgi:serine/threonine-protein kinase